MDSTPQKYYSAIIIIYSPSCYPKPTFLLHSAEDNFTRFDEYVKKKTQNAFFFT